MHPLRELLDELGAEGRQIVRFAAGDEAVVDDDLLVDPLAAGVADVGLQRRPGRDPPAAHHVGLDQRPGTVADDPDRLAGCREVGDETDGARIDAQLVGIGDATGQDETVEIVDAGLVERPVDGERELLSR